MGNLLVIHDNAVDRGVLSSTGTWSVPLSTIQNPRPDRFARTPDLNPANMQYLLSLPVAQTFRYIWVGPTNLNNSGTFRLRLYSNAALTTLVKDTGVSVVGTARLIVSKALFEVAWKDPYFWTGRVPRTDPDRKGLSFLVDLGANYTAKYILHEFTNAANPDGYFKIAREYLGIELSPAINFAPGSSYKNLTNTLVKKTPAGVATFKRRPSYFSGQFNFPFASTAEAWEDWWKLKELANLNKQIVVLPDRSAANIDRQGGLARLEELPSFSYENIDLNPTSLAVTQWI